MTTLSNKVRLFNREIHDETTLSLSLRLFWNFQRGWAFHISLPTLLSVSLEMLVRSLFDSDPTLRPTTLYFTVEFHEIFLDDTRLFYKLKLISPLIFIG